MMKTCKRCNRSLDESEFSCHRNACKECERERSREYQRAHPEKALQWRTANREKTREYSRKYEQAHKEERRERSREKMRTYRATDPDKIRESKRKWYAANREKIMEMARRYHEANLEKIRQQRMQQREANRDKIAEAQRKWRAANREEIRERKRQYRERNLQKVREQHRQSRARNLQKIRARRQANREKIAEARRKWYKLNPAFRLSLVCRTRVTNALKGRDKSAKTKEIIGCTWEELRCHIESQFTKGMHWNNHGSGPGKWEIDHIIPFAAYPTRTHEELKKVCHWTNLRPLWSKKNRRKGPKWTGTLPLLEV